MKIAIFLGAVIVAVVYIGTKYREDQERRAHIAADIPFVGNEFDSDVDPVEDVLLQVLSECMEAYCEDCSMVLAQGTHPFHDKVAAVAYAHRETFDHETFVRSWAE